MLTSTGPLRYLVHGASKIALLRLVGLGLSFALSVTLAHWLSAADFGTYKYILSWVGTLGTLSVFGLDRMMVRDVSVYHSRGAWGMLRGSLRWASGITLLVSSILLGLLFIVFSLPGFVSRFFPSEIGSVAALLVLLTALVNVQKSALRGLNYLAGSQFLDTVLQPLSMLMLVAAIVWLEIGGIGASQALAACTIASVITFAIGARLVHRAVPHEARVAAPLYDHRAWFASTSRMFVLTGLLVVNSRIDILTLGLFSSPEVVGTYSVALRGASLIPLALNIMVIAMAPTLASLHAAGEQAALQAILTRMSQLVLIGGVPVAVGMIFFGRWFLLLFGPGFVQGQTALTILSCGQLVNVAAGPVAALLTMTGHERDAVFSLGFSAGANLVLSLALIPAWGMGGAAVAAATSLVLWNIVMLLFVRQRLHLYPTVLGALRRHPRK